MIAIVLQNATVRRSAQMMQTLDERYGTPVSYDNKDLYVTWALDDIRSVAEDELRKALPALYGVGPASVEYILSDVFRRNDAIVHISPWKQKIYSKLFFDRDPVDPAPVPELLPYLNAEFSPYPMLAAHYFWKDLLWRRNYEPVVWLEELIRL